MPTPYQPTWASLDSRPMPAWFNEAKFGIFIHWGVYSVPAWRPLSDTLYASYAEWYYATVVGDMEFGGDAFHKAQFGEDFEYRDFGSMFKAELFDPDYWADLFHRAGAKYVVLTSKHHDGFCLWPTQSPYKKNWNSLDIGPKRDLVGDLTSAVRNKGLRMGLYYSITEWESIPSPTRSKTGYLVNTKMVEKYGIPEDKYVHEHLPLQLKELVMNYQPSLIFSDGGEWDWDEHYWHTQNLLAWLYNEAPNKDEVVVNDRWCHGMTGRHGDYFSSEYQDTDAVTIAYPWEESRGIGGSYGLNRAENIDNYRTSQELVHELIDVVSRGGNMLLNVGPTADGRIPPLQQQRLVDIGDWLRVNGEAIYDSTVWKHAEVNKQDKLRFTTVGNNLYVLCLQWPTQEIVLSGISVGDHLSVSMLGVKQPVPSNVQDGMLIISPPVISPAEAPCAHAYVFKVEGGG